MEAGMRVYGADSAYLQIPLWSTPIPAAAAKHALLYVFWSQPQTGAYSSVQEEREGGGLHTLCASAAPQSCPGS